MHDIYNILYNMIYQSYYVLLYIIKIFIIYFSQYFNTFILIKVKLILTISNLRSDYLAENTALYTTYLGYGKSSKRNI
jgi:hypothetical protein